MKKKPAKKRGFAVMDKAQGIAIASMGGKALSKGPKGRRHMSDIGRAGAKVRIANYKVVPK